MRACAMWAGLAMSGISTAAMAAFPADLKWLQMPGNFTAPIAMDAPNDGSGRLFVVERCPVNVGGVDQGRVRIIKNGALLATPALQIGVSCDGEQGLIGLAIHPNFASNGTFYIAYTKPAAAPSLGTFPNQAVARCVLPSPSADAMTGACTDVMQVADLADNHNGGDIHFGPDGYLYWSMGDGGVQNDPNGFAQCEQRKLEDGKPGWPANQATTCGTIPAGNTDPVYSMLGKILRLDVDHPTAAAGNDMCGATAGSAAEYSIPVGNPRKGQAGFCGEIWFKGLRNPFRFSFDRRTGDILIGDVGNNNWEEIDSIAADPVTHVTPGGTNLQWPNCEGFHGHGTNSACTIAPANSVGPVYDYPHGGNVPSGWTGPVGIAVLGGVVYRGPYGSVRGTYFFAELSGDKAYISPRGAPPWTATEFTPATPLNNFGAYAYGQDPQGNLYLVNNSDGHLYRLDSADEIFSDGLEGQ